jgi:hypothetical protein
MNQLYELLSIGTFPLFGGKVNVLDTTGDFKRKSRSGKSICTECDYIMACGLWVIIVWVRKYGKNQWLWLDENTMLEKYLSQAQ